MQSKFGVIKMFRPTLGTTTTIANNSLIIIILIKLQSAFYIHNWIWTPALLFYDFC